MKILAVDDHMLIRVALQHVLRALDPSLELLEAQNLDEARALASGHTDIDLILLDLALPGSSGFQALRELRSQCPQTPVVVLSGADQTEVVIGALDEGAMGFISKASTSTLLVTALRLVLSGGVYLPPQVLHYGGPPVFEAPANGKAFHYRDIGLTERQAQVLAFLVQGKPNKLICRELNLAEGTVKIHVTAILKALKVTNRTQAVIAVGRLGLKFEGLHPKPARVGDAPLRSD